MLPGCARNCTAPTLKAQRMGIPVIGRVKGMDGLKKKGQWLSKDFEVHTIKASAPLVADNCFSVKFEIDTTDKKNAT